MLLCFLVPKGMTEGLRRDTALVRAIADYAGLTPAGVAQAIGVAKTTINRPFNGTATTRLSQRTMEKLRAKYPDFPGWTASVGEVQTSFDHQRADPSDNSQKTVEVREIDLTFGMGSTYLDVPVTEETHLFPRDWLRRFTRSSPDKLFFAQGIGDSMEPTLFDSDLMLIDTSQTQLNMAEKIWAIAYADCGMIKRLRPVPGGGVEVWSDKKEISPFTAYDGEMEIIGRVVAVQRKL